MRTTPDNQNINKAAEDVWINGLRFGMRSAEKTDYLLKKMNQEARNLTVNINVDVVVPIAADVAEFLAWTGAIRYGEALAKMKNPWAAAVWGAFSAMGTPSVNKKVENFIRRFGLPADVVNREKVLSATNISPAQQAEFFEKTNQIFDLLKKKQEGGLNAAQEKKLNDIQQGVYDLQNKAEANFQERRAANGISAEADDLQTLAALNAQNLKRHSQSGLDDLQNTQKLFDKLNDPTISAAEFKRTQEQLKQTLQNENNNQGAYAADIAQGQNLADLNHFSGRPDVSEQLKKMTESHTQMMNAMDNLRNEQREMHAETMQHLSYEGEKTRKHVTDEAEKTRKHVTEEIEKVSAKIDKVSDQVTSLTQFVIGFATEVVKSLNSISAGQEKLAEMMVNSTTMLANEIRESRKDIANMHYDLHYSAQHLVEMDHRQQAQFKEVFGAKYQEIKDALLTQFVRWGKPTAEETGIFRRYVADVIRWATYYAKGATIAGSRPEKYRNDIAMQKKLIDIFSKPDGFENNINFLVGYMHDILGFPYDKTLVNPFAWSDAALLLLTFPDLLSGFSGNADIKRDIAAVSAEAIAFLNFIIDIKTNPEFFEKIFLDYASALKGVSGDVLQSSMEYARENIIKMVIEKYDARLSDHTSHKKFIGDVSDKSLNRLYTFRMNPKSNAFFARLTGDSWKRE